MRTSEQAAAAVAPQAAGRVEERTPVNSWPQARRTARESARPLPAVARPLVAAADHVLAEPLTARTDLPAFDSSAMDGWAVSGPGPWRLCGEVLAGGAGPALLADGTAVRIATGARLPAGATGVLRREDGEAEGGEAEGGRLAAARPPGPGQDVRPRGQECHTGDELLPAGALVTPAVLGLAAAAGYDELRVVPRPSVEILVVGDELLHWGLPRDGRVRDALGPLLGPWLGALGSDVLGIRLVRDDAEALQRAITSSSADVVITTGGTASGPVDFVHPVLRGLPARLLVDGVPVRPGHPMLLAELPGGRHFVGLPGNPLAAVSGVVTLAEPLLRALAGRPRSPARTAPLAAAVPGHPTDTRLVPVALRPGGEVRALHFAGPAMLRGVAAADALAVITPGGGRAGTQVELVDLGW